MDRHTPQPGTAAAVTPNPGSPAAGTDERAEILRLLQQVMAEDHPVVLRPRRGAEVCRLRQIDAAKGSMVLELVGESPSAGPLLTSAVVKATAHLEQMDVLFDLQGLTVDTGTAGPGVRAALPAQMQRVRRRDSMRLPVRATSRGGPLGRVRWTSGSDEVLVRVLDLSSGGCGLVLPPTTAGLPAGARIDSLVLELGDGSSLKVEAVVKRVGEIRLAGSPAASPYLGCEWLEMPPASKRILQQHIELLKRRRRMVPQRA